MARFAYLTDAKTFVQQFDGERWVNVPPDFRDKCLSDIAEHRQVLIWRIRYAEFYRDDSGLTTHAADASRECQAEGCKNLPWAETGMCREHS